MDAKPQGRLDVVATPIGNLADLSERMRTTLAEADCIAAEDTRRTQQLLRHLGLKKPLVSLHAHNEAARSAQLLERLRRGARIALVSDAGTPLLSDPGLALVRAAGAAGIPVCAVPGPTAIAAALSVAGLPTERFCFEGFLPPRPHARRRRLEQLQSEERTLVFFEAPHRLGETLADLAQIFGAERPAAVARELTKFHETVHRGSLGELAARARLDSEMARGEMTLVVAGAAAEQSEREPRELQLARRLAALLARGVGPARLAAVLTSVCGLPRHRAYALAVSQREQSAAQRD
ncbi:MAG: 16S rRNA (cytidine(1402)-2'-O)-methyltransferase [Steroidobacteraceae bacterium]|nr:16S rRNA (cytidine(1402)-2'-O)-methyltransferase [Steroidobacteraceae bacterium]MDW8258081.1 16S rRNA (cytidine(1402)-2'-O)-methyltransferase [Gammaproteobacteria bacterium]